MPAVMLRLVACLLPLFLWGCAPRPPEGLEGYRHVGGRSYSRLVEIGDDGAVARAGDIVSVRLKYATWGDSVFFAGGRRFQLSPSGYPGSIDACLSTLAVGDSAVFFIDAHDFFTHTLASTLPGFLDSGDYMRVDVRMLSIQDSLAFIQEREAFAHWIEDFGEYEKVMLQQYLNNQHHRVHPVDSLYYLPVTPGQGPRPRNGDTVTIEFEGRFLNGRYFDSTRKRFEPFVFVLGQRWQVIEGLERAVRLMRKGETAIFVLPSGVAFGQDGSSTGIVPPFTPVVFEVEMVDLKPGRAQDEAA